MDERLASTDRVHVDVTAWSASTEGMASGTCGFGCDLSSTSKVMVGSGEHGEHTGAGVLAGQEGSVRGAITGPQAGLLGRASDGVADPDL